MSELARRLEKIDFLQAAGTWTTHLLCEIGNHENDLALTPEAVRERWQRFLRGRPSADAEALRHRARLRRLYLYVHVPFCYRKCHFCAYHVDEGVSRDKTNAYVEALLESVRWYAAAFRGHAFRGLYIGGGTPSSLSEEQLQRVLGAIRGAFAFSRPRNLAIELNPASTTPRKLDVVAAAGIRRVSFGVQSFERDVLNEENRTWHSPSRVRDLVAHARGLGLATNVDLIYGLKGDELETFEKSLDDVLSFRPDQVSLYNFRAPSLERFDAAAEEQQAKRRLKDEPVIAAAVRRSGYLAMSCPDGALLRLPSVRSWLRSRHYEYPQQVHTSDDSVLGLGDGADSRIWGELAYREHSAGKRFDGAGVRYRGTAQSPCDEMRRFVLYTLQSGRRVWLPEFRARYGQELMDVFGAAVRGAVELGAGRLGRLSFALDATDARLRARAARLFCSDGFIDRWFERVKAQRAEGGKSRGRLPQEQRSFGGAAVREADQYYHGAAERILVVTRSEHRFSLHGPGAPKRAAVGDVGISVMGEGGAGDADAELARLVEVVKAVTPAPTLAAVFGGLVASEELQRMSCCVMYWPDAPG